MDQRKEMEGRVKVFSFEVKKNEMEVILVKYGGCESQMQQNLRSMEDAKVKCNKKNENL